jgi:broad specificity phosphatase PhoE
MMSGTLDARTARSSPPIAASAQQKWPQTLWVVRHGQSAGNVARDEAEAGGLHDIAIAERDVDVPLSSLGERQSDALGEWLAGLAPDEAPTILLCSPYLRARQTADRILAAFDRPPRIERILDERLREKEFGILDRLTRHGIRAKYPELSAQWRHVGKFYFRPPGGESWCDVILRLRSFIEMVTREHRGERVLVVGHQVIVNCLRYLLERLDEAQILAIDREADVPNCGVTSYRFDAGAGRHGKLVLDLQNFVLPLRDAGAPVTAEPDRPAAPSS